MSDELELGGLWPAEARGLRQPVRASLLLEASALALGLDTMRINRRGFLCGDAGKPLSLGFQDSISSETSRTAIRACDDRVMRKALLAHAGVRIPTSRSFAVRAEDDAAAFAKQLRGRVRVKPKSTEFGGSAAMQSAEEVRTALRTVQAEAGKASVALVERDIGGREFAFFVVGDMVASVVRLRGGVWAQEVYRAGADGFGDLSPHLQRHALDVKRALPLMPHCEIRMVIGDRLATAERAVVVTVSPTVALLGRRQTRVWSMFMAERMVRHAARAYVAGRHVARGAQLSFEISEVPDQASLRAAVEEWFADHGIAGEARAHATKIRGSMVAPPGAAAAFSGLVKRGRLGGGTPQTITLRHES